VRRNIQEGMSPDDARRKVLAGFGDIDRVKARCRTSGKRKQRRRRRRDWRGDVAQDVRFGLRQVRRDPTFALIVAVTLAVGIGANTAVFTVVNGVLLRPLPYPEPDRLVQILTRFLPESGYEAEDFPVSAREAIAYRDATAALGGVAYYNRVDQTLTGEGGEPLRLSAVASSVDLLDVLGVRPELGRWFITEEAQPEGPPVVVLGNALWASRFGADPTVVGRSVVLSGRVAEVIGVMPAGFAFPRGGTEAYLPYQLDEADPGGWGGHGPQAVGRLTPGISKVQADAELAGLVRSWRDEFGHPQQGHSLYLVPLARATVQSVSSTLWMLMGAVSLVLLIAIANVANMLLARAEARMREVSVRMALGASRSRVTRQFLAESLVLAIIGAALGVALAVGAVRMVLWLNPEALPRSETIALDLPVLGFTAAVALGAALFFGLVPAFQGRSSGGAEALTGDRRIAGSLRSRHMRAGLIATEVALALVVVLGAGLVTQSLVRTLAVDSGMSPAGRLSFELFLPEGVYSTPDEVRTGVRAIVEGMEAVPGVRSASFASSLPLTGTRYIPDFQIEGRPRPGPGERALSATVMVVTPGHLKTAEIGLIRGRTFQIGDRDGGPLAAIVSQEAARIYWPGEDPVGQRIAFQFNREDIPWATIVGVVEDTHADDLRGEIDPQIYLPHGQEQGFWARNARDGFVLLHTTVEPRSVVPSVRQALREVDPNLPLAGVRTLEEIVSVSVADSRFVSALLGSFGAIALGLAMVGVYGVVACSVARRTKEIGVRTALGADRQRVVGLMVQEGVRPALLGLGVGVVVAFVGSSALRGMLYGVSPTDPKTFVALPLALAFVALLASWIPSRRATRVSPTEALREE
jgi:putative ABC transport system permease protein